MPKRLLTRDGSAGSDPANPSAIIGVYSTTLRRRVRILRHEWRDDHFVDERHAEARDLAGLIPVIYPAVTVSPAPRNDLVTIFLTGIPGVNQLPHVTPPR